MVVVMISNIYMYIAASVSCGLWTFRTLSEAPLPLLYGATSSPDKVLASRLLRWVAAPSVWM